MTKANSCERDELEGRRRDDRSLAATFAGVRRITGRVPSKAPAPTAAYSQPTTVSCPNRCAAATTSTAWSAVTAAALETYAAGEESKHRIANHDRNPRRHAVRQALGSRHSPPIRTGERGEQTAAKKNVAASTPMSTWGATNGSRSAPKAGDTRMLELLSAGVDALDPPEAQRAS